MLSDEVSSTCSLLRKQKFRLEMRISKQSKEKGSGTDLHFTWNTDDKRKAGI